MAKHTSKKNNKFIAKNIFIAVVILVAIKFLNGVGIFNKSEDMKDKISIHFIDVGQADSILIKDEKNAMLIDGGNNEDGDLVVNYLKSQGVKHLNYIIGTHGHEDHIGGLDNVIKSFTVDKIYMPKSTTTTKTFQDVVNATKAKGLTFTEPKTGSGFTLGNMTFKILAPNSTNYESKNNESIVLKGTYGNTSFMFTGDAEEISEKEILKQNYNLNADLLKVGHHGSDTSTSDEFLNAVNPKYAIISVGKNNKYGHPKEKIIDKLKKRNISTYRTDEKGTIIATSDGTNIEFNFQKK
jgi:competence protein ComEC